MKISVTIISLFILLTLGGIISGKASIFGWGDVCGSIDSDLVKKHTGMDDFTVVSKRGVNGLCEIIINSDNTFSSYYGNTKFLVSGEMQENGVSLTEKKLYELNKDRLKSAIKEIEEYVAFTYEPAAVKIETPLYMVTDPLCPYCNKIGGPIKDLADRIGVRVKVLFYTVHGEKGKKKSIEAVCRNIENPGFNLISYNGSEWKTKSTEKKYLCAKGDALITKTEKFSEKIGIDSVPFFLVNDGNHVSGAVLEDVEALFKQVP